MRVLCFDPSGNWSEGKGHTGWALFDGSGELLKFGDIAAEDYESTERYWYAHKELMDELDIHYLRFDKIVCESYRLQSGKALQQSWSSMETSQLIGFLRMDAWDRDVDWIFQDPKDKVSVADPILVRLGVFELKGGKHYCQGKPTNLHMRDAIRHGIFYFKHNKELKKQ